MNIHTAETWVRIPSKLKGKLLELSTLSVSSRLVQDTANIYSLDKQKGTDGGKMLEVNKIYQGDCLELMKQIEDKSVNLVLCDLPYGVTQNPEDKVIDLKKLWEQYKRIIKDNGIIVLTAQQPFTTDLINSNRECFKYELIWDKQVSSGSLNSNNRPLQRHESILIFYNKKSTYNQQLRKGKEHRVIKTGGGGNYGEMKTNKRIESHTNLWKPTTILSFRKDIVMTRFHPTQKPVALFEYLIKTYTNEGDLVLDNCIGSGTTAVACKKTNRNYIGFELEEKYVKIANKRLSQEVLI